LKISVQIGYTGPGRSGGHGWRLGHGQSLGLMSGFPGRRGAATIHGRPIAGKTDLRIVVRSPRSKTHVAANQGVTNPDESRPPLVPRPSVPGRYPSCLADEKKSPKALGIVESRGSEIKKPLIDHPIIPRSSFRWSKRIDAADRLIPEIGVLAPSRRRGPRLSGRAKGPGVIRPNGTFMKLIFRRTYPVSRGAHAAVRFLWRCARRPGFRYAEFSGQQRSVTETCV